MIIPASAVGFVFSGALINVQSLESVAFSFSWHPGATGWQEVLKEYAKRCCWIVLREKIVALLIMTTEYRRRT
jgi:hypothetical protein